MKKILLAFLLFFAFIANAQKNYQIESQLKLKTVPFGENTDSLVSISANGLIRKLPKSSISSTSTTPNLNQVASKGNYISDSESTLTMYPYGIDIDDTSNNRTMMNRYGFIVGKLDENKWANLSNNSLMFRVGVGDRDKFLRYGTVPSIFTTVFLDMPNVSGIIPVSVGGHFADANGNIEISSTIPTLDQVLATGDTAIDKQMTIYSIPDNLNASFGHYGISLFNNSSGSSISLNTDFSLTYRRGFGHDKIFRYGTETSYSYYYDLPTASGTMPMSLNGIFADDNGNIIASPITTTFTTNDGKTVTVTNGVITNVE
ncbi:hypothetical protein [Flavobacterium sp. 5]|uniref:hypothetical protein n=1 Tax=Flavobacterium sp. 5 TaxID=2035199 RepID=UPI000C2C5498|nr:hypothetical protein [Flavobacterium sp. 5]PKB18394.1 hypothetical protein CLU82_3669 [Flavobacterium sp. 5]